MSAPLADDVQISPGAGLRCKGTIIFAFMQIEDCFLLEKLIYTCVYQKKCVTLQVKIVYNSKNNIL